MTQKARDERGHGSGFSRRVLFSDAALGRTLSTSVPLWIACSKKLLRSEATFGAQTLCPATQQKYPATSLALRACS